MVSRHDEKAMIPKVSIIIVNYNSESVLAPCIDSVYKHISDVAHEIIIVDNDSVKGSLAILQQKYPETKFIFNTQNLGFGAANNRGAQVARGDYLFFLNPDTLLLDNAVLKFYNFLEKENLEAVSCGGNLVNSEGGSVTSYGNFPSISQEFGDMGFRRFFQRHYDRKLKIGKTVMDLNGVAKVPYITGADIFIRKNVFLESGGFDETFFLYYEETDLFYRLHKKRYDSYLLPEVKIVHLEGPSLISKGKLNLDKWAVWEKSKYYYFKKHKGVLAALLVRKFQLLSLILHWFFGRISFPLWKTLRITLNA